jgi:hypothetical protein
MADIQKQIESAQNLEASLNINNRVSSSAQQTSTSMSIVEKYLSEYLPNMMSLLLVVPDNPDQGVLYLLTGLLNLVQKHISWENIEIKFSLLMSAMAILIALKQETYLYHVDDSKVSVFF